MEKIEERLGQLTSRENQVLDKLLEGLLNKEIAFELGITERTVKHHRAKLLEKMGTKSMVSLAYEMAEFRLKTASSREEIREALRLIPSEELVKAGIV